MGRAFIGPMVIHSIHCCSYILVQSCDAIFVIKNNIQVVGAVSLGSPTLLVCGVHPPTSQYPIAISRSCLSLERITKKPRQRPK